MEHKIPLTVRISIDRRNLFEFVKYGFVPFRIGDLWCEGSITSIRLAAVDVPYEII